MKFKRLSLVLLATTFTVISCGVKGSPKPPPVDKPSAVNHITLKQVGRLAVIIFDYQKSYIDGRPIREEISFRVVRDYREIYPDIYSSENTYWFFDRLSEKQQCYEVVVKTSSKSSNPSNRVCLIPQKLSDMVVAPPSLKNTDEGVVVELPVQGEVFLYRTPSYEKFIPTPYTEAQKTFLDVNVQENQTVCYYYTVKIAQNIETDYSKTACIVYRDTFPPSAPSRGKIVKNEDGSATLIWQESSSTDVIGYIVFKNSKPLFDLPVKTYYFVDKTYNDGDTYHVYAVDKAKNKSEPLEIR